MNPNNSSIRRRKLPAELMNELFGSMPFENAFGLLAKIPNGLLARNVQKMINGIKEALKNNKLNAEDCGPKLSISEDGLISNHSGQKSWNTVRSVLPIPTFNFIGINKPSISFYFEMQILSKNLYRNIGICIGVCCQQFPLEGAVLGMRNSCGIGSKDMMWIEETIIQFEEIKADFIGFGIIQHHSNSSMECFATFNGKLLGKASLTGKFIKCQLFPAAHSACEGDSIRMNFGKEEWLFKEFKKVLY